MKRQCLQFSLKYSSKREKGKKATEAYMANSLIIIKSVIAIEGFIWTLMLLQHYTINSFSFFPHISGSLRMTSTSEKTA